MTTCNTFLGAMPANEKNLIKKQQQYKQNKTKQKNNNTNITKLPRAFNEMFRLRFAANSAASSWFIWLFLRSKAWRLWLQPTPSQNTANELSSKPTAFHSRHKLEFKKII